MRPAVLPSVHAARRACLRHSERRRKRGSLLAARPGSHFRFLFPAGAIFAEIELGGGSELRCVERFRKKWKGETEVSRNGGCGA